MASLTLAVPAVRERLAGRSPDLDALVLSSLPGVGDVTYRRILDTLGTATAALGALSEIKRIAPRVRLDATARGAAETAARKHMDRARQADLRLWSYGDVGYPRRLTALHDPPAVLWGRGDARCLGTEPTCAVVGARRATPYGLRTATALGEALGRAGVVVVSGMAMGVDAAAHRGAMRGGGMTIAVLGSGADTPTPRIQRGLYREICDRGLVVSEFPPGCAAQASHFPRRNRIIAALAESLVVVEATRRSGSLITVDHALDVGASIYAVPGPVDGVRSEGTNALLADGAGVVTSPDGLVAALLGSDRPLHGTANFDNSGERAMGDAEGPDPVLAALSEGPLTPDEVAMRLGLTMSEVLAEVSRLEVQGWVERQPGGRVSRRGQPPRHGG